MNTNLLALRMLARNLPLADKIQAFRELREEIEDALGAPLNRDIRSIEHSAGAQSKVFAISLLPLIWRHVMSHPRGTPFTLLDVGPGSGFGSDLIGSLHRGKTLGYPIKVSVMDIRDTYFDYIDYRHANINGHFKEDVFATKRKFDLVMCSHVIEHVPQPIDFVQALQRIATQKVWVTAPWMEPRDAMTKGHLHSFDDAFVNAFPDATHSIEESIAWGAFMNPRYKTFIMELPGLG